MANQNFDTAMQPSSFVNFMRSFWGRALRVFAGMVIMYVGFIVLEGTAGLIVGLLGIVPIAAGIMNFCLLGPVFGVDFWGRPKKQFRTTVQRKR